MQDKSRRDDSARQNKCWGKNCWTNAEKGKETARLTDMQCCRGESVRYSQALSDLNIWFVASYVAEVVLKNLAVGPWAYIKDNW